MKQLNLPLALMILILSISCNDKEKVKPECTELEFTVQETPASCNSSDGKITVNSPSSTALPIKYSIDGNTFQDSNEFSNLGSGSYTITVRDQNSCIGSKVVELDENNNLQIEAATTSSGCGGTNGTMTITSTGGNGNLQYSLDQSSLQPGNQFTGLTSKSYRVTVKDANGCSKVATIRVPSGISYATAIKPIIDNSCAVAGCHVQGGQSPNFTVFANVKANAAKVKARTADKSMPKNGSLTADQIQAIACWVDDGALEN